MNIVISGGTGFIGGHLRRKLLQEGHYLTVITRFPEDYANVAAENQQFISWDAELADKMEQADAVINLAGTSIFGSRWTQSVKDRLYSSRIESTRKMVEAIKKAENPPEVFLSGSAAGYYGNRGEEQLTETNSSGDDFLVQLCIDWEEEAQKVSEAGVRLVTSRTGIVLEQGGGALDQMLLPFKLFVGGPVGSGQQYFPWIHMRDLCRAFCFAMNNQDFSGPFNVSAPHPVTMRTFAEALGDRLGRPSFFRVPEWLLQLGLGDAAAPITNSLRMQPEKLVESGFEFKYPYLSDALIDIL